MKFVKAPTTFEYFKHLSDDDRLYFLSDDELQALKSILLEMLLDVDSVCKEHGISYTLGGGSCLGAIRHSGFIPWDDDIDINFSRQDFQRFLATFPQAFSDKYVLQIPGITKEYPVLFARIRKKGTVVKTRDDFFLSDTGAFLDLFVVENTFDNAILRGIHGLGCQTFGFLVSCRKFFRDRAFLQPLFEHTRKGHVIFRVKTGIGLLLCPVSVTRLVRWADGWNALCRNSDSQYVSIPAGRNHFFGELYHRKDVLKTKTVSFEGHDLPCPANAELYLTKLYGNFWKIPEEADREKHPFFGRVEL